MVLALSLPLDLPLRQLMMTMIFGVVIFTLLVQGLSIKALLHRLGLIRLTTQEAYETRKGEIYALGRVQQELERLVERGVLSRGNRELLAQRLHDRLTELHDRVREIIFTDTIPIRGRKLLPKMTVISVAEMLGEVIRRAHEGASVGAMFDE